MEKSKSAASRFYRGALSAVIRWWRQPTRYVLIDVQGNPAIIPAARPLFRPYADWGMPDMPQLSATDYERRKSRRELALAFQNRARDVEAYVAGR